MTHRSTVASLAVALLALLSAGPAWAGLNVWTGTGPVGGPIRSVLVDPVTPSTVYVGTVGRGVFKSTDGGATWAETGSELASRTVRALVSNGAGTIYAGVEDAVDAVSGGVFQSANGGATWTAMDTGLENKKVQALAWDGASLYAGTREEEKPGDQLFTGGVFKWNGATWTQMNSGLPNQSSRRVQALAVDSRPNPPVIYAGTQGEGVFKSVDGGATWERMDNPINQGFRSDCLEKPEILALVVDETIPLVGATGATLYAGATGNVLSGCEEETPANGGHQGMGAGFFRYVPGFDCNDVLSSLGCWDRRMAGDFEILRPTTVSAEVWAIAMNTDASPAWIFAGTDLGVFVSEDSAGNWDGVPQITSPDGLVGLPIRALGIAPTAGCGDGTVTVHAGSGGRGMFSRCTDVPSIGDEPWTPGNSGLTALRAQSVAVGLRAGLKAVFAGLLGGGIIASVDGGASWQDTAEDSLTVRGLAVDPTDAGVIYAATGEGVIKTTDGGDSWVPASAGLPTNGTQDPSIPPRSVRAIAVDPANPNVVYAAVGGVYRSLDAGATWAALNGNLPTAVTCGSSCPGNGTVSALLIDHGPGANATWGTLYAAADGSGVYRSTDGGTTWMLMATGLADLSVVSLAFDPLGQSGPTLYAGTSTGKVFRSVSGGTWALFGSGLPGQPVSALIVRLGAPSKLFAGINGGGVYSIPANGTTWSAMNSGLSSLNVAGLGFDPEGSGRLHAATLGRGIFDFEIEAVNPPFVSITSPPPTYTASATPVDLSGSAGGGALGVFQVFWSTNRGHAGFATGINPWSASVVLEPGANVVTVTAVDNSFNQSSATITVALPETSPCPAEVIIDNLPPGQTSASVAFAGTWQTAPQQGAFGANASLRSSGSALDTYTWKSQVFSTTQACTYQVFAWWTASPFRSTKVPYRVLTNTGGPVTVKVNQQSGGGQWNLLGTFTFPAGVKGKIRVTDRNGMAAADAVRFLLVP